MDELKFANRLKSLPVLMSTCIWFSQNYERLKASNVLIRQTCELAETTVQASVHAVADPLTLRFKTQLDVLDCLACTQLDRLEHAFPLINKDMNTIVTESKSMILGSNLVAHKFLDRIEKSLVESKQRQTPSSNTTKKQQQEMKHLNKSIEASASTGDDQQQLVVATANSYPSLRVRSRILAILLYQVARARVEEQVRLGYAIVKHSCPCVEAMSRRADEWRHAAVYTLHDRFSFTKDKLDLYKEYLDVLMRQFMVQDGRSLEHVHSLEERTKIIIRRNIGNLLIIIQLVSTNASKLSSYVLDNAVVALSKKTLCHISQLFSKPNNEKLTQELISKLISVQTSALQWMVPNFDAFGVLDELDDEISSSSTPISSNYTERPSSESIRRQLAILADEIDQTPIVRRFNARDSTTLSSSNFSSSNIS